MSDNEVDNDSEVIFHVRSDDVSTPQRECNPDEGISSPQDLQPDERSNMSCDDRYRDCENIDVVSSDHAVNDERLPVSEVNMMFNGITGALREVVKELQDMKNQCTNSQGMERQNQHRSSSRETQHSDRYYGYRSSSRDHDATYTARSNDGNSDNHSRQVRFNGSCNQYSDRRDSEPYAVDLDASPYAHRSHPSEREATHHRQYEYPHTVGDHTPVSNHGLQRSACPFKINSFTGNEDWATWIARFEAIGDRYRWTQSQKMDNILPRFEGLAAEFVFCQLPRRVLSNYSELVAELNSRYRVIETARSFAAKFSKRNQRPGEKAEEYAAELKRLYDKAHGYRDRQIRDGDLVRRFLDGLLDEEIQFEVEYHKEPNSIDEAVFHAVNMIQMRGGRNHERKYGNSTRRTTSSEVDMGEQNVRRPGFDSSSDDSSKVEQVTRDRSEQGRQPESTNELLLRIMERLDKLEVKQEVKTLERHAPLEDRYRDIECYNCHRKGHMSRRCPEKRNNRYRSGQGQSDRGSVENEPVVFTTDTGASKTIIAARVYEKLDGSKRPVLKETACLKGVAGLPVKERGKAMFKLCLGPVEIIKEVIVADIEDDALLGNDILMAGENGPADLILSQNKVVLNGVDIPVFQVGNERRARRVIVANEVDLPGETETVVNLYVQRYEVDDFVEDNNIVEPSSKFKETHPLQMASTLVKTNEAPICKVPVLNQFRLSIELRQDADIGQAEIIDRAINVISGTEHESETENFGFARRVQISTHVKRPLIVEQRGGKVQETGIPEHPRQLFQSATKGRYTRERRCIAGVLTKHKGTSSTSPDVLNQMHCSFPLRHTDVRKTKEKISQGFYWCNMKQDVRWFIKKCNMCVSDKPPLQTPRASMGHVISGSDWDTLAYVGPFPVYLHTSAKRSKEAYDTQVVLNSYQCGDIVLDLHEMRKFGVCPKLEKRHDGPFRVKQRISQLNFEIQLDRVGSCKILHHNKLKLYEEDSSPRWMLTLAKRLEQSS